MGQKSGLLLLCGDGNYEYNGLLRQCSQRYVDEAL